MRKVYRVKGTEGIETYIEIMAESEDGYDVLITSVREFSTKQSTEHITLDLLDSCVRTGYLVEIAQSTAMAG